MTDQALVSIILPNRDHSEYLVNALDALRAQTWQRLEILVVDDASTDSSQDLVRSVSASDARVRLFPLVQHHGINRAVEFGLRQAKGEYVYVAAADDFVDPRFVETCVSQLLLCPEAGLCFSDPSEYQPEEGKTVPFPLYLSKEPVFFTADGLVSLLTANYFHISGNTAIFRLASFRAAGGYIVDLEWLSDWFVTLVIALREGACYVPERLTYVMIRPDSYSAVSSADVGRQRGAFARFIDIVSSPQNADVALLMRRAGILPEYHLRTLVWLARTAEGRQFISLRVLGRILYHSIWWYLRPYVPAGVRRKLRAISSAGSERASRTIRPR